MECFVTTGVSSTVPPTAGAGPATPPRPPRPCAATLHAANTPIARVRIIREMTPDRRAPLPGETHSREAYDARRVDVPLLIVQQLAARARRRLQESIEGRRAAPLQVVVVFAH